MSTIPFEAPKAGSVAITPAVRPGTRLHDPYSTVRIPNFRRFLAGNILSTIGSQMLYLAIGWEIYQTTNSPTALGLVGFFQVLPILLFAIPAGQLIDRFDRKTIILIDQFLLGLTGCFLAIVSFNRAAIPDFAILHFINNLFEKLALLFHDKNHVFAAPYIPIMFGLLLLNGAVRSINQPAKQSFLPQLVPSSVFPNAASWHSSAVEASTMIGPTLAGFVLGSLQVGTGGTLWPYAAVYLLMALLQFVSMVFFARSHATQRVPTRVPLAFGSLGNGIRFVWNTKIIMATITLDLIYVILGGSIVLLPLFSRDILHGGPAALGWLRAAPSFGAVAMAIVMAHLPPSRCAGRMLLWAVCCFGVATIAFGLSHHFGLSLVLLFAIGACDNVSSVVRQTLVQMLTPDEMRGRVSAVKSVFSSTSDGLGALESGFAAALLGPVAAVVLGGVGTILIVPVVAMLWPELRAFGSLHDAGCGSMAMPQGGIPRTGNSSKRPGKDPAQP